MEVLGGTRVGESCNARWCHVDLSRAKLTIPKSKTAAGERVIDISPMLLDELKAWKARTRLDGPEDFVFATRTGRPTKRSNVRRWTLMPAVERANEARAGRYAGLMMSTNWRPVCLVNNESRTHEER